ncbi:uncharacterized protein SCHCODRAFT_02683546 [Schizophyllum commune H4-8]|uniref:uncharacterized protein n=1 Tax=Schizophyllum commune (strain H4-8 / FGSC 9210) TaxID=578458 RepID=UPI00215FC8A6|nr:uncharacterized protein SCHCODRAFT_02683546 [Schizophyllum commune H4-8]KAI5900720.1 hypothetical protein SCHCODRAFT_02683546 [Schizophyllum commune H4-8]
MPSCSSSSMRLHCPISGPNSELITVQLIEEKPRKIEEPQARPVSNDRVTAAHRRQLGCMEWLWGLPRGGLSYYLSSEQNMIYFREDIAELYAGAEFTLAPTFKLYCDIMDFLKHAGVVDRSEEDESPRRPLTALCPPSDRYRYVFIPFTEAARKLQSAFKMQPQTEDDMNGGVHPIYDIPLLPGSDQFPIVECHTHPFSICNFGQEAFDHRDFGGRIASQWAICTNFVLRQWRYPKFTVPQWFLDAPKKGANDYEVTASEKSGYSLGSLINSLQRAPGDLDEILKVSEVDYPELRQMVLEWFERNKQPSKLRRSKRIAERMARASSYGSAAKRSSHSSATKSSSHNSLDPAPSPPRRRHRKASPSARAYDVNKERAIPPWVQQNGRFPTGEFSSNDWAFFYYSTSLVGRLPDRESGS